MGEGFPLWSLASMAAEGQEPLRDWISLSLCFLLFLRSRILAFHRFLNSRRSVTPLGLKFSHDFYLDISFLAVKEGHQPPYGVGTRVRGAPAPLGCAPASWAPRASSRVDFSSRILQIFQKYSPSVFIPFGFRLIWGFCET